MRKRPYPLSELEDIPGTTVFTAKRSREAYHLHKFCNGFGLSDPGCHSKFIVELLSSL